VNLDNIHNVYFVGIGGIGMSALARYFVANDKQVAGYDKTKTRITDALEDLGVIIRFNDNVEEIQKGFLNPENTLVVYTPAIPDSHTELSYFRAKNFTVVKRSEVLGLITQSTVCLAVAGTHGKTTTTSILGHLLNECGVEMTAFLGGISENYNSNLILSGNKVSVVEADEFDRSFLTLSPDYACITSMDADHLDIYGEKEALETSFRDFTKKIKPNGKLFVKKGLPIKGVTYAVDEEADYTASDIKIENGSYVFTLKTPSQNIENLTWTNIGEWSRVDDEVTFSINGQTDTMTITEITDTTLVMNGVSVQEVNQGGIVATTTTDLTVTFTKQ